MFLGHACYKRKSPTYRSNTFCWKNKWHKKALKIEKQLKKKSRVISWLNNEKLNHGDLLNPIYLKLTHAQMQAFQRRWAHTYVYLDFWMLKCLKMAWFLDYVYKGFSEENSVPFFIFTYHKCWLSRLEEIITSSFPFSPEGSRCWWL